MSRQNRNQTRNHSKKRNRHLSQERSYNPHKRKKENQNQPNNAYKTLNELKAGDIIRTYIPFEENTPDYFNGHHPSTIRPQPYRNRFGQAGKERLVVYIGKDSYDSMLYLNVTASHTNKYDSIHQYELKDKEAIDKRNIYEHSYVETTSLRALPTTKTKKFQVTGRLSHRDYQNIMHRLTHAAIHIVSEKDYRGVVPDDMLSSWEKTHVGSKYRKQTNNKGDTIYTYKNHCITRTQDGMVHYHKRYTKEMVKQLVEHRENIKFDLPPEPRELSTFAEHIESLSLPQRQHRRVQPQS